MMTFHDIEAEKAVAGWLCAGHGLETIHASYPDINAAWLPTLGPIYSAARSIEARGGKANNLTISDQLARAGQLPGKVDPASITPGHNTWDAVEHSLHKLRDLYGKRCVAELAADMARGMTPQEAVMLLEPLATPQGGDKLKARRFDVSNPPPPAVPLLTLKGQGVLTAGNIAVMTGQAKTGKSAMLSAIMAGQLDHREHLGIEAASTGGRAVIHFDTEQSRHDHWQLINRAIRRAGAQDVPAWLRSYSVADLSTDERRALLAAEVAQASALHGGIALVLIDGVADLLHDPNDPAEAFGLVEELHRLAAKYDCGVLTILHLNPATQTSKSRGHLGSQLERKAESILQLEKDDEAVTAWLYRARNAFLPKSEGQRFAWDDNAGMFMPVAGSRSEAVAAAKAERERAELERLAGLVGRNGPRKPGQFIKDIETLENCAKATAERRFARMKATSIIHQNLNGEWEMVA